MHIWFWRQTTSIICIRMLCQQFNADYITPLVNNRRSASRSWSHERRSTCTRATCREWTVGTWPPPSHTSSTVCWAPSPHPTLASPSMRWVSSPTDLRTKLCYWKSHKVFLVKAVSPRDVFVLGIHMNCTKQLWFFPSTVVWWWWCSVLCPWKNIVSKWQQDSVT